jgi:hypothetical protein
MRKIRTVGGLAVAAVLAAVVLGACGKGSPVAEVSSPVGSPASVISPSSSPVASPTPVDRYPSQLACRLPVVAQLGGGVERGWIALPGGQYARDNGTVSNFSDGTVANYYLTEHMPSYDWGARVWVPAEQQYVSPDGSDYVVQIDSRSKLPTGFYLVDAKTGSKRLIQSVTGPGGGVYWTLLGYQSEGIYLGGLGAAGDAPTQVPGLWLMDSLTGHVRLIDRSHIWDMIGGGSAWAVDAPPNAVGTWTVYRLDLASGQIKKSYASEHFGGFVAPTPDGDVLVRGGDDGGPARIFTLTTGNEVVPLALPSGFSSDYGGHVANPGVWIALSNGTALYTKANGMQGVVHSPYGLGLFPVGGCR